MIIVMTMIVMIIIMTIVDDNDDDVSHHDVFDTDVLRCVTDSPRVVAIFSYRDLRGAL